MELKQGPTHDMTTDFSRAKSSDPTLRSAGPPLSNYLHLAFHLHLWKYVSLALKMRLSWSAQSSLFHWEWAEQDKSNLLSPCVPLTNCLCRDAPSPVPGSRQISGCLHDQYLGKRAPLGNWKNIDESIHIFWQRKHRNALQTHVLLKGTLGDGEVGKFLTISLDFP